LRGSALALALLWIPAHASAHIGHEIGRAERYLKLDVEGGHARLVVSLSLGAQEGAAALRSADADGDGEVSQSESDAYLAAWSRGLASELPVSVDGERLELEWGEPYMDPIGAIRAMPVSVEMVAHFELDGGRQRIAIEDRMVRREVYDRTDVAFVARDGARLIASGADDDVREPTPELAYPSSYRRGSHVTLTAIVESPERARDPTIAIAIAIAAGIALGIVIFLIVRRRKKLSKA
jgi:hypothetical protein